VPEYTIKDPRSNRTVTVRGESPPTEQELHQIFAKLNQPNQQTARPEDFTDQAPQPEGSAVGRFASGVGEMLNPVTLVKGLYQAGRHPIQTAGALYDAQAAQFGKAGEALSQGHYSEAIGHGAAGILPVIGPIAAEAGEQIARGDVAGGLGKGVGLLAPLGVKPAAQAVKSVIPSSVKATAAASLETGAARRVADVMAPKVGANKQRFGRMADKVAPKIAEDLAADGAPWTREGLHSQVGGKLEGAESGLDAAADARNPGAAHPTKPLIDALLQKRAQLTAEPIQGSKLVPEYVGTNKRTGAAGDSQASAAGPAATRRDGTRGALAQLGENPPEAELTRVYYRDAKKSGYDGSLDEFRADFGARLKDAQELVGDLSTIHDEYSHTALLKEIAKGGGIGADKGFPGEIAQLWEHSTGIIPGKGLSKTTGRLKKSRTLSGGGIAGVSGVLKKSGGLSLDYMAEYLRQDPRFAHIDGPNALLDAIEQSRLAKPVNAGGIADALEAVGVRPGTKWWEVGDDLSFNPADIEADAAGLTRQARPIGEPVVPKHDRARVREIDNAISELNQLGPIARYEAIRRLRQSYDQPAKAKYVPSLTQDFLKKQSQASGAADVTGVLREHLAQMEPATAEANATYHIYKTADDVLAATREIERTRPRVGRQIMARLTGSVVGGQQAGAAGAVAGYLGGPLIEQAVASGLTTKLKTAALMQRLAKAIRAGDAATSNSLLDTMMQELKTTGAVQAGRVTSPSGSQTDGVPALAGP
jgi:hypothetical protein